MGTFIVQLGIMSMQASVAILVVLLLRRIFTVCGVSKKYTMLLWLIPFLLLVCPWKISSPVSFWQFAPSDYDTKRAEDAWIRQEHSWSEVEIGTVEAVLDDTTHSETSGGNQVDNAKEQGVLMQESQTALIPIESWETFWLVTSVIWFDGMFLFLVYATISYLRLRKKVRLCLWKEDNVYYVDNIAVPMVLGFVNPKVYLPSGMDKAHIPYVVAHENTHIRRKDPFFKILAYVVACVHWFNPLVWLAYFFFEKDMEMACDEETIQNIGVDKKREYATALLQLSTGSRMMFAVPLAFGEGDTKGRIKNVMKYKKTVKSAAVLAIGAGVLMLFVFMTKDSGNPYTAVLTNKAPTGAQDELEKEQQALEEALQAELEAKEEAEQQAIREEMAKLEAEVSAKREETEKQVRITEMNQKSELTLAMIKEAEEKHFLHELDFAKFTNGENLREEATYSLNYYIDFYFTDYEYHAEGEEYRLGVSLWLEDDSLDAIYITRMSDSDMRWLYSAEEDKYADILEEFLATKERIEDWLTVELPKGYTVGTYNANYGYMGGALIYPQVYELYGEEIYVPADWYHAGCISRMPDAIERYEFVDGKLQEHRGVPWNHTSAEFMEVLELDWQAIFMEVNHDLYTAADMGAMEEAGIDISQVELTSDYWYFFFVKEGEDTSYYLSLAKNCFTKEEAIAIAKTVEIKE